VIAVLGGLGAAAAWAISTLCSSRSSRLMEPTSVVAWVMLVGLLATVPLAISDGIPRALGGAAGAWLLASGIGNVTGLVLAYFALRIGQVSLVAPVVSTEGAVAAMIALVAGESLAASTAAALVVIAAGICFAATPPPGVSDTADASSGREPVGTGGRARGLGPVHGSSRAVLLAIAAALSFGFGLYSTARAGSKLPAAWVVLAPRLVGSLVLAAPLAALGRLRLTRRAAPLVIAAGVCEVIGFFSYNAGARHGIAVAAVLSSQFAALAAIAAYVLFRERLGRVQLVGVATVITGVALLSALSA
jgi:drug/metabolite transporter (DMT)-like permease